MIKVALPGVNGRMGQAIAKAVLQSPDLNLVVATARDTSILIGQKVANSDVVITNHIANPEFDVLIDFTLPPGVMSHLDYCLAHKRAMVIGATGFNTQELESITSAAKIIPIVLSSNMSIGVNVCYKLIANAAKLLGKEWDMSIIDIHHQHKKDSPSGTAKHMAKLLVDNSGKNLNDIEILSDRRGDIVGTHIVTFKTQSEFITIGHEAQDRSIFADGAAAAARWVWNKTPGLYSMQDIIS